MTELDSEVLARLYAEVINGVTKAASRFHDQPGFSETWDRAVAEIERLKTDYPGYGIDLPL